MKYLVYAMALTLMAALWRGDPASMRTTYTDTLTGSIAPPGSSSLSVEADASGALPGKVVISINLNHANVTSGAWWLTVRERNADGSISEVGALTGNVSSGTVSLNADGSVASLNSLTLTIQQGSGRYAAVTGGTGALDGTLNGQSSPSFTGTLSVNF
jgi:hypothetical protein